MPFQQLTVEFQVLGELDGTTPAPRISLDPTDPDYVRPDERGILVVEIDGNLGLIDPDLSGGRSSRGPRCVPWVYIDSPGAGDAFAQFAVLDALPGNGLSTPFPQKQGPFTSGLKEFYSESPVCVPMGSLLGVIGYPETLGRKIVRVNIVGSSDIEEQALIDQACCCLQAACDPQSGTAPVIQSVLPVTLSPGEGQTVTITGINLGEIVGVEGVPPAVTLDIAPLVWALVGANPDGTGEVYFGEILDGQATLEEVSVTFDLTGATEGTYTLVGYFADEPSCNTTAAALVEGGFPIQITVGDAPGDCPTIDSVSGAVNVGTGTVGNVLVVFGTNLDGVTLGQVALVPQGVGPAPLNITNVQINLDGNLEVTYDAGFVTGLFDLQIAVPDCPTAIETGAVTIISA